MVTRAELLSEAAALSRSTDFPPLKRLCNLVLSMEPDSNRQDEIDYLNARLADKNREINELKASMDRMKVEMSNMIPRRSRMSDEEKREYKRQYMRNYRSGKHGDSKNALESFVESVVDESDVAKNKEARDDITEKESLQVLPARQDTNSGENC